MASYLREESAAALPFPPVADLGHAPFPWTTRLMSRASDAEPTIGCPDCRSWQAVATGKDRTDGRTSFSVEIPKGHQNLRRKRREYTFLFVGRIFQTDQKTSLTFSVGWKFSSRDVVTRLHRIYGKLTLADALMIDLSSQ